MKHLIALLALALAVSPATSQDAAVAVPDIVSMDDRPVWFSAASLFDQNGNVAPELGNRLRLELVHQSADFRRKFGSASTYGLVDGDVPAVSYCPESWAVDFVHFASPEYKAFDLHLLLSEVAVLAEIVEVVPGLLSDGQPTALVVLDRVEPLRGNVQVPEFALLPLGQLVVRDHVICSPIESEVVPSLVPERGQKVVIVSDWRDQPVVGGAQGLAVVDEGAHLKWSYGPAGPPTLRGLRSRVDDLEVQGAFGIAADLAKQSSYSKERRQFISEWNRLSDSGCFGDGPIERLSTGELATAACPVER